MKGIVLISHGPLAEGMKETAEIFFGPEIPQLQALCLGVQEDAEDYRQRISQAITEVNTGDGVLIFADLLGGTPCNQSAFLLNENVTVLTGMNLPMVMECLGLRMGGEVSAEAVEEAARTGILNFNQLLEAKKKSGRKRRGQEETQE